MHAYNVRTAAVIEIDKDGALRQLINKLINRSTNASTSKGPYRGRNIYGGGYLIPIKNFNFLTPPYEVTKFDFGDF